MSLANSVALDQSPRLRRLIRVYTICYSSSCFQTQQHIVKWTLFNF